MGGWEWGLCHYNYFATQEREYLWPSRVSAKKEAAKIRGKGRANKRVAVSRQQGQTHGPPISVCCTDLLEEMKILGFHIRPTEAGTLGLGCTGLGFNETPLSCEPYAYPCCTVTPSRPSYSIRIAPWKMQAEYYTLGESNWCTLHQ